MSTKKIIENKQTKKQNKYVYTVHSVQSMKRIQKAAYCLQL